ncbi:MAG: hypothetical protein U5R48_04245 [Gammaproteobacteria bacterium]|nr:hypothetical protein [Gammaproteobacteria bacterium]
MTRFDLLLLLLRPIVFVILPALGAHEWLREPALGAIVGLAFMWNFMTTSENAQLALAFREIREDLEDVKHREPTH